MTDPQLLLSKYFYGGLSESKTQELAEWIRQSSENARVFAEEAFMMRTLRDGLRGEQQQRELVAASPDQELREILAHRRPKVRRPVKARPRFARLRAAAILLFVGVVAWMVGSALIPSEPAPVVAATVVESRSAAWGNEAIATGSEIALNQPLELQRGTAVLELASGVTMLITAPAKLHLTSQESVQLTLGRLMTTCPKGTEGFKVQTASATIVDLGTRFVVVAYSNGVTDTCVHQGRVELAAKPSSAATPSAPQTLTAGEARRVESDGETIKQISAAKMGYVSPYAKAILASKPLCYWRLDEAPGETKIIDAGSLKHHGTLHGGVTLGLPGPLAGDSNHAASFDYKTKGHITLPFSNELQLQENFTLEAWIRLPKTSPSDKPRIISCGCVKPYQGFGFGVAGTDDVESYKKAGVTLRCPTFTVFGYQEYYADRAVLPNTWTHVVVVIKAGILKFYVNGTPCGVIYKDSRDVKGAIRVVGRVRTKPSDRPFCIGANPVVVGNQREFWRGGLGEVAIYTHALSAEEIKAHVRAAGR